MKLIVRNQIKIIPKSLGLFFGNFDLKHFFRKNRENNNFRFSLIFSEFGVRRNFCICKFIYPLNMCFDSVHSV